MPVLESSIRIQSHTVMQNWLSDVDRVHGKLLHIWQICLYMTSYYWTTVVAQVLQILCFMIL